MWFSNAKGSSCKVSPAVSEYSSSGRGHQCLSEVIASCLARDLQQAVLSAASFVFWLHVAFYSKEIQIDCILWPQRLDSYRHSTSRKWIKNPTAKEFLGHLLLGFLLHESGVKFSMFCFSQLQKCWGDSFCEDSAEFTDCHPCGGNGSFCRPSGCSSSLWTLLGPE